VGENNRVAVKRELLVRGGWILQINAMDRSCLALARPATAAPSPPVCCIFQQSP